jgi:hypothetical protein
MASSISSESTQLESARKKDQQTIQKTSSSSIHSIELGGKTEVLASSEYDKTGFADGKMEEIHQSIEIDNLTDVDNQGKKEPEVAIGRNAAILLFVG